MNTAPSPRPLTIIPPISVFPPPIVNRYIFLLIKLMAKFLKLAVIIMFMGDRKLLIVGIDPGITTAYAVLDIEGKLIKTSSSKEFGLNQIISETTELGKVVLVGTDKSKIPNLVHLFAAKL